MPGPSYKHTLNLPSTPFPMKANLPATEPSWLQHWAQIDLYCQIRTSRKGRPSYVLHDGPPYANGAIHLGHALGDLIKDFVVKSKTMAGFDAPFVPGWDCHGLPIEIKVDKELGARKTGMPALEIRRACRDYAMKYVALQREGFKRLGITGQWDRPYLTLLPEYEATVASLILRFIKEELAYKGLRAVYWCIHDRTALAEAEVEYENHESPTVWVRYAFDSGELPLGWKQAGVDPARLHALTWTTTPWTLPASMALAFHPELEYVAAEAADGRQYLLAAALFEPAVKSASLGDLQIIVRATGAQLEGVTFQHPWLPRKIRAVLADYITTDQGSGIVHTAPGHGAEDFATGEKYGLQILCPVGPDGRFFGSESEPFTGQQIFEANPRIVEHLRAVGALAAAAPYTHSYPHCWRCHHPVIFRATEQWFIGMERARLRERAVEAIGKVRWMPEWGEERLRQMVSTRPDWCISRQRTWGVPIPVFVCSHCRQYLRNDAIDARIVDVFGSEGSDAWFAKPASAFIPDGTLCSGCSHNVFEQERDIVDVWFESGCSHAAVLGRPGHENLPWPSDMYTEGADQFRGWFQSSLLVAIAARGAAPFREVLVHGWVLDDSGVAMSKSLDNGIEPQAVIDKFGAEILRLWVASSEARDDVSVSPAILDRLAEAYRKLRNTFRYMLSNLGDFDAKHHSVPDGELWDLDLYMLGRSACMAEDMRDAYDAYAFHRAYRRFSDFCTVELSAFYFDILKDRLYTFAPDNRGRRSAQTVLHRILELSVRLIAPLLPFTAEEVWRLLPGPRAASVHLETFHDLRVSSACLDWDRLRIWREMALRALEAARDRKEIGAALEARLELSASGPDLALLRSATDHLPALFIVSQVDIGEAPSDADASVTVHRARGAKCERCWNYSLAVDADPNYPGVCERCSRTLREMGAASAPPL